MMTGDMLGSDGNPLPGNDNPGDGTPTTDDGTPSTDDGTPTTDDGTPSTDDGTPTTDDGTPSTDTPVPDDGSPVVVPNNCVPGTPKTTQLPRLTNVQYDNSLFELTGLQLDLAGTTLLADSKGDMDASTWGAYLSAASKVATALMADANARAKAFPCTTQDDACAQQIISTLGAKAFRRPLSDLESARLLQRYTDRATLTETGSWDEGMALVVEGIFSSPNYLTRAETTEQADGDRFQLSGYEVASRLSFMLWDSMPDQALFDAAAAGTLTSNAGIAEQAARMLADPRAHAPMAEFHKGYLHMGPGTRWQNYTRDKATYPSFNDATMPPALEAETAAFLDSVTFGGGSFLDLMTSTTGFVSADTAALYGLNPADFGATPTQVDLGAGRPGILTRAGFLAANAYADRASPIHRGAFIQKEVLCTVIGTPPAGAAGTPLPTDAALVTNRQRVDAQTAATGCTECHHPLVNPTGFAFEGFDATGAAQTMEGTTAIDTAANVIVGGTTVAVTGAADLVNAIANSPEAQRCYTRKLAEFAYDRALDPADVCTIDAIAPKLVQDGYTIANLITDLTQTDYFRYRALETEVAQ